MASWRRESITGHRRRIGTAREEGKFNPNDVWGGRRDHYPKQSRVPAMTARLAARHQNNATAFPPRRRAEPARHAGRQWRLFVGSRLPCFCRNMRRRPIKLLPRRNSCIFLAEGWKGGTRKTRLYRQPPRAVSATGPFLSDVPEQLTRGRAPQKRTSQSPPCVTSSVLGVLNTISMPVGGQNVNYSIYSAVSWSPTLSQTMKSTYLHAISAF